MAQQNRNKKFKGYKWWNLSKRLRNTVVSLIFAIFQLHSPLAVSWRKIDFQNTFLKGDG